MLAQIFDASRDHFELALVVAVALFAVAAVLFHPSPSPTRHAPWASTVMAIGLAVFAFAFLFLM